MKIVPDFRVAGDRTILNASTLVALLILLGGSASLAIGTPQLGDAPRAPQPDEVRRLRQAVPVAPLVSSPLSVTTTNREEVRNFFNTVYADSENPTMGWTGDVGTCSPGTTLSTFRDKVVQRINYFRAMAGMLAGIVLNDTWNGKDQQAALMMSANNALSHFPPPSWSCYTVDGTNASANSNISLGNAGPDAINGFIEDHGSNNSIVGHRRWILYPQTQTMGTGDVPVNGTYNSANATWVFDGNYGGPRPATRQPYISWPPPGYAPYQVVYPRWSFAYPNADFSSASVTMSTNGVPIPVTLETVATGYGENTLVWYPSNLDPTNPYQWPQPATDTTYSVNVQSVKIGGSPSNFNYTVTVFDPSVPGPDTVLPVVSGPDQPAVGGANSYSFVTVPTATGYQWQQSQRAPFTAVEGAENGYANVITNTSPGYSVIVTTPVASGGHAFHLATPDPSDQFLTLNRTLLPGAGAQLQFKSQLGWATSTQFANVQVSLDQGNSWNDVYNQAGSDGSGESSFNTRTVSLASYAGRSILVRFRYAYTGGTYYPDTTTGVGWYIDDISFSGTEEQTSPVASTSVAGNTFNFSPSQATNYALQVRAQVYNNFYLEWGPVKSVTAISVTPVVASFTASPTNGVAPLAVTFTDTSTGTITNRFWNFGDGGTTNTSLTSFQRTYNAAGTNTVVLIVSGAAGVSTNTRPNYIVVTNPPPTGLLQVNISPAGAVSAGAQWQVDSGAWQNSGATVSGLSVGSHTVHFNTVTGWTSPADQSVTINNGSTTTATGTYVQQTGSLQVNISPAGAVTAGAQWQVDGGAWQNSGATVAGLSVGSHTVHFTTVTGWTSPANQSVTINNGSTTTATGTYIQQTGSLQVNISPAGAVSAGAQWQVDGGAWQNNGATVSGLGVGSHSVHFKPITAWAAPADQSVTINNGATTTAAGTYTPVDTTPPTLTILTPPDYQIFGTAALTVTGTASDASGIQSVTVNGASAAMIGANWSAPITLALGTNTLTVIATDNSTAQNTATQIVHAVFAPGSPTPPPQIIAAPAVTNALLQIANRFIVAALDTNGFTVAALDPGGNPLNYQWSFGDGTASDWSLLSGATHIYTTANCGPYTASVTVSNGVAAVSTNLPVTVACALTIVKPSGKLTATVNFDPKKSNVDKASLTATLDLGPAYQPFNPLNLQLTVDIGGAQVPFTLDKKGRGLSGTSTCRLSYTKPTKTKPGFWTIKVVLSKGTWHDPWAAHGLVNATVKSPGVPVVLPVAVLVGDEAFAAEPTLKYTATIKKTGTAK
jgi:PKD repeat protein